MIAVSFGFLTKLPRASHEPYKGTGHVSPRRGMSVEVIVHCLAHYLENGVFFRGWRTPATTARAWWRPWGESALPVTVFSGFHATS